MRFLLPLLLLTGSLAFGQDQPPNFIILFADDLGYGDLGVYGSETIRTPNLDRMAREGLRFTDFYAAAPFCSPSRAAILTGRYPVRAGVPYVLFPTELTGLPPGEITIAEILREQGYATTAIGKWHLGYPRELRAHRQGFDSYFGLPYSNDMYKWPRDEPLRAQHGFWEIPLFENDRVVEAPPNQHTLTKRYTERAIHFLRENRDRPFFLYLPHTFPHSPQYASEDFEGRSPHGLWADTVEEIDWSTGEILAEVRRLDLDRNTVVVFTSDNGPPRDNYPNGRFGKRSRGGSAGPLRGGKGRTFEGGMREPGIFWSPGLIPAGRVTGEIASTMDLLPTFAEMAGAEIPSDRIIDGRSIAGLLTGEDDRLTEEPFFYYFGEQLQAVRLGRWKLTLQIDEHPEEHPFSLWFYNNSELFKRQHRLWPEPTLADLENDIGETTNVASAHPEIVQRLQRIAEQFDEAMQRDKSPLYFVH